MTETTSQDLPIETLSARDEAAVEENVARPAEGHEIPLDLRMTTLADVCRSAVADVRERFPERTVQYVPDPHARVGAGEWDARRLGYAVTILLEDALKRTPEGENVSLRWRDHGSDVVLRVQYPRPIERGDGFVTYFEDGVRPDGAADDVGTLRILAALRVARQHGGRLGRIRTRAGTAYVLELPRNGAAADTLE